MRQNIGQTVEVALDPHFAHTVGFRNTENPICHDIVNVTASTKVELTCETKAWFVKP